MRQGEKPGKRKAETRQSVGRKSLKSDALGRRELEKRLAEALEREAQALERQTATSEILRVISSSPTDIQPVFNTIARNAVHLCDGMSGSLYRFDGELIHLVADVNVAGQAWHEWGRTFPRPLSDGGGLRHVIETGRILNVANVRNWEGFTPAAREMFDGDRTALWGRQQPAHRLDETLIARGRGRRSPGAR